MNHWFVYLWMGAVVWQGMASEPEPKRRLKSSMEEVYLVHPEEASDFREWLSNGMWYGRLRFNHFAWQWEQESESQKDHMTHGLGDSLIFRTANLKGWSLHMGFYGVENPISGLNPDKQDVGLVKAGKDMFNRNAIRHGGTYDGDFGLASLAQAYLQYQMRGFTIKAGRQIHEGLLTRSNDTKMIPNTFQGLTASYQVNPNHQVTGSWFSRQKLRDHEDFHDVIAVNGWDDNDDSGRHKGLTSDRLNAADIHTDLRILGWNGAWNAQWKTDAWFYQVPDLFSSSSLELNFSQPMAANHTFRVGVRAMVQTDDGAGTIGGAALSGVLAGQSGAVDGYDTADSVDAAMLAARLTWLWQGGSLMLGYSDVNDKADLIAPWRGFPTGGYTRSMGQYHWEAGTRSWMLKTTLDLEKLSGMQGFRVAADTAWIDVDDEKILAGSVSATDRWLVHLDLWYAFVGLPGLEARMRALWLHADASPSADDPSYRELRTELNYLF